MGTEKPQNIHDECYMLAENGAQWPNTQFSHDCFTIFYTFGSKGLFMYHWLHNMKFHKATGQMQQLSHILYQNSISLQCHYYHKNGWKREHS